MGAGILKTLLKTTLADGDIATICRFMPVLKKWWKYANLAGIAMAASILLQLPTPLVTRYVIDRVLPSGKISLLGVIVILMCGLLIARLISGVISSLFLTVFRERVLIHMRMEMFKHIEQLEVSSCDNSKAGELISRIMNDGGNLQGLMAESILSILRNGLTLVVVLVTMFILDCRLALMSICLLPCFIWFARVFSCRIGEASRRFQESLELVYGALDETIAGIRVVKSFCREKTEAHRFFLLLVRNFRESMKYTMTLLGSSGVSAALEGIAPMLLIWYGGKQVMAGTISLGTLLAFMTFLSYLYSAAYGLVTTNINISASLASLRRVYELFDMPTERDDGSLPWEKMELEGNIVFEDVWFAYNGGPPVLKGLSFTIRPGELVALVGRSGAGKTSVINLLMRFHDPQSGRILIDGIDIRRFPLRWLRSKMGIVPQGTFLFDMDIAENIRYGKPNATDAEIVEAAMAADAHGFITRLPDGYRTKVGERGVKLSGGEKQRIAIARAIIKKPSVLILDEATSEVDSKSECLIQDALIPLMRGRTTIIVAHRLSTIMKADKVILIEDGRLIAVGPHELLQRTNDFYRFICETQFIDSRANK